MEAAAAAARAADAGAEGGVGGAAGDGAHRRRVAAHGAHGELVRRLAAAPHLHLHYVEVRQAAGRAAVSVPTSVPARYTQDTLYRERYTCHQETPVRGKYLP